MMKNDALLTSQAVLNVFAGERAHNAAHHEQRVGDGPKQSIQLVHFELGRVELGSLGIELRLVLLDLVCVGGQVVGNRLVVELEVVLVELGELGVGRVSAAGVRGELIAERLLLVHDHLVLVQGGLVVREARLELEAFRVVRWEVGGGEEVLDERRGQIGGANVVAEYERGYASRNAAQGEIGRPFLFSFDLFYEFKNLLDIFNS